MGNSTLLALHTANAAFVTDHLLIGGDLDMRDEDHAVEQLQELQDAGLTHILDVRHEWSDEAFVGQLAPRLGYLHHGIDDAGQQVPAHWFETGVLWALEVIGRGGVVLSHCHMGINRGPSMGFAILLGLGWEVGDALNAIQRVRPIAYVAYAEDVLRWHHNRNATTAAHRVNDRRKLRRWRTENDLDVADVIRKIRLAEDQGEAQTHFGASSTSHLQGAERAVPWASSPRACDEGLQPIAEVGVSAQPVGQAIATQTVMPRP